MKVYEICTASLSTFARLWKKGFSFEKLNGGQYSGQFSPRLAVLSL